MALSDIEAVLQFLRNNGLSDSESALMEDILEKSYLASYDFERFLFPMVPPPPPLKIPAIRRLMKEAVPGKREDALDFNSDSSDEFVSLGSYTADFCSSEFTNPYGIHTARGSSSKSSSDRLSQFGTARDYHDFDLQTDVDWYRENDDDYTMPPCFDGSDSFGGPSEDKFVMTQGIEKQSDNLKSSNLIPEQIQFLDRTDSTHKQWPSNYMSIDSVKEDVQVRECYQLEKIYGQDPKDCGLTKFQNIDLNCFEYNTANESNVKSNSAVEHKNNYKDSSYSINKIFYRDCVEKQKSVADHIEVVNKECKLVGKNSYKTGVEKVVNGAPSPDAVANEVGGDSTSNELLIYDTNEDEYEVFNLRVLHRKNRTGFEEHKDLPIVISSVIAGRYYVTEYLGSAAFSKVVQARDLQTGVDVCLKIIKNDKDFFDQSLDEIKLLKFVNTHDPGDERHILRLYDYFYYQEHLIIVCELLRANLYEFQKYNGESGGEPYFTVSRLQAITRQCMEALEYLHSLGVIHCDLKPENILMKSYKRCEIKVIDLGSSCFQTDNLCLYVQSRSYRAPEVILGLPYDQKIDLWSLGCILAELCSGEVLFPNEAVVMILARMVGLLGPIDLDMLAEGQETDKYFTKEYDLYHINEETNQLEYIIPEESCLESHLQVSDVGFIDFVRNLLEINPQRRPTAAEALQHPWLSYSY